MARRQADETTITTSIRINADVWLKGKHRALDTGKNIGQYLEDLILDDIKKGKH